MSFSSAIGTGGDWVAATRACIEQLEQQPDATVGFCYVTDAIADDLSRIVDTLRHELGIEDWVGTVGMGVCGAGREVYDQPAVAVLAGELPNDSYTLFDVGDAGLSDLSTEAARWIQQRQPFFGVVHGDPANTDIVAVLQAVSAKMQGGFLVGGLSCSRGSMPQSARQITGGGLSGILLAPEVTVATRLTQGCTPLAPMHLVTRAESNLVYELDGRPALDVLREDLGDVTPERIATLGGHLFVGLPIAGSDTGDYLVRNLMGIDPQSGVVAIGDYTQEGQRLLFCKRDQASAADDLKRMLEALKKAIKGVTPKAGIYYTCIGRGQNLFVTPNEELATIQDVLGEFPLTGFFANGEICYDRLYTYTGVLTVFT